MPREHAAVHPMPSKWLTAFICCRISPKHSNPSSSTIALH
jgi:hypothetical protein